MRLSLIICLVLLLPQDHRLAEGRQSKQSQKTPITQGNPESAQAVSEDAISSAVDDAERLMKTGKFREAMAAYQLALDTDSDSESLLFGLAMAQTQAGLTKEAVASYEKVLKVNPQLWEAEINIGILLTRTQQFQSALFHFKRALELNPKNFGAAIGTAQVLDALNRPAESITAYQTALPLSEGSADRFQIHAALGRLYLRNQEWDNAERELVTARQYQEDAALDLELAKLLFRNGKYEGSLEILQSLVLESPDDAEVQEALGRTLSKQKKFEPATAALEQALRCQHDALRRTGISLELADLYEQLGQAERASQVLQAAAENSSDPQLHFHLGAILLKQRNTAAAKDSFLRALKLNPDCVDCYSNLGAIFMVQEQYPEAITAFSRFKAARPEVPGTYFYLGIAFDKLDDVENAISHYRKFLELDHGQSDKQDFQARERVKVLEKRPKKR